MHPVFETIPHDFGVHVNIKEIGIIYHRQGKKGHNVRLDLRNSQEVNHATVLYYVMALTQPFWASDVI